MKIRVIFYRFNSIAKVANYHNMVRVAAEMVISKVHETIIHKFVQCTDIFFKKFQNAVIHTSRRHNDENATVP